MLTNIVYSLILKTSFLMQYAFISFGEPSLVFSILKVLITCR